MQQKHETSIVALSSSKESSLMLSQYNTTASSGDSKETSRLPDRSRRASRRRSSSCNKCPASPVFQRMSENMVSASADPIAPVRSILDDDSSSSGDPAKPLHPLLEAVKGEGGDDVTVLREILDRQSREVREALEATDESGMTALMHAAWKGKYKSVKFLIDQGADVNGGKHEHDYSALHFSALAGKEDVCKLLVENGAKIDKVNTVRRTPAQMAAFVGNSSCVAVINNYVPKEDVYYYTRKQPFEEEAKLPLPLAKPIHNLVMSMNTHPVRIAMMLKENQILLENLSKVCQILELMSDKEFKNRKDVNEVLSLKYHILHYISRDIKKQMEKDQESDAKKTTPLIDRWIKSMLIGRDSDGFPVFQEDFLRQGIKEFPYKESSLFKMLVTNFSHCKNYGDGATAAEYINQAFNGQKGFKDDEECRTCGNDQAKKKCSNCKSVQYCDAVCQKTHWFNHKRFCPLLKESYEKYQQQKNEQSTAAKVEP